jgi:hypothetical protein
LCFGQQLCDAGALVNKVFEVAPGFLFERDKCFVGLLDADLNFVAEAFDLGAAVRYVLRPLLSGRRLRSSPVNYLTFCPACGLIRVAGPHVLDQRAVSGRLVRAV